MSNTETRTINAHTARMIELHDKLLKIWGHGLLSSFQIQRDTGATPAEVVSLEDNRRIIHFETDDSGMKLFRAAFK